MLTYMLINPKGSPHLFVLGFFCNGINTYWFILQVKTTTFVMFWNFKLIWAATLMLQCRCSTQAVSLQCSEESAAPATNCTIQMEIECIGFEYMWTDSKNSSICDSGDSNYECKWDNQTFVSLVSKGAICETYKVFIETSCGFAKSDISVTRCGNGELLFVFSLHICVRIFTDYDHCSSQDPTSTPSPIPPTDGPSHFPVAEVSAVICVLVVLMTLFILCKIKGIFKGFTNERIPRCSQASYTWDMLCKKSLCLYLFLSLVCVLYAITDVFKMMFELWLGIIDMKCIHFSSNCRLYISK